MQRIRIHYSKTQPMRYTSNLDVHKVWERTLRRARLPLAYSQGFHPQPRINQACPLPLGFLSDAEFIDVWLEKIYDHSTILQQILSSVPPGIENLHIEDIELHAPSPQTLVQRVTYEALLLDRIDGKTLRQDIENLLKEEVVIRTRRGKSYDLRPLIIDLQLMHADNVKDNNGNRLLSMKLSALQGATGRPDEVLSALGIDPFDCRIKRISLELSSDHL